VAVAVLQCKKLPYEMDMVQSDSIAATTKIIQMLACTKPKIVELSS
jgi:hypothetical protein